MVRILEFDILFDKDIPVYCPDEILTGRVIVKLSEIKTINLKLTLNGIEDVEYLRIAFIEL